MRILKPSICGIFLALLLIACNQPKTPMERAAFKLKEKGFISETQYAHLAPYNGDSTGYKQLLLEACYKSMLDRYQISPFSTFYFAIDDSISEADLETLKAQTKERINELNSIGILTKKEYDHLIELAHQYPLHPDMFWQELLAFYHFSFKNSSEKLLALNQYLLDSGIITIAEWRLLNDEISQDIKTNSLHMLLSTKKAFLLGDELLTAHTDELLLKNYLESLNKQYQFVNADSVSVYVNADKKSAEVSIVHNGKRLSYLQSYDPSFQGYEGFYRLFNKVLSEKGSNDRLYLLGYVDIIGSMAGRNRKVLMLLNKEQAEGLKEYALNFSWQINKENHDDSYLASITKSLDELKKTGLFNGITQSKYDSIKESILLQNLSIAEALQEFPNLTSQFDVEMGNIDNPYEALLNGFARISKGKFNPTDIKDGFDIEKGGQFEVSFKWLDETHKIELTVTDDWVDVNFDPFVNNLLSAKTDGYKFHYSTYEYYIMLNDEQYKLLEQKGLFDWDVY